MKVGLVLEGGAMRALYSAGVLDVMMQHQIKVDGIVAVSAGALFGVNYFSQQINRTLRYNLKFASDPNYMGFRTLLKTGNIVNKEMAYYRIPTELDRFDEEAFERYAGTFHVAVTNVKTGKAEYYPVTQPLQQMELLRATSAMPYVSQFVRWNGQDYLDGGIADSIPLAYAQTLGFDRLIVVLTRPLEYRKEPSQRWLAKAVYRHYPALKQAILDRHEHYNRTVNRIIELEQQGNIFVIRPSTSFSIGRIERDVKKLQAMYNLGEKDAQTQIESLLSYLNTKH